MRKVFLLLALLFTVTISLNSCRETTKEKEDVEEAAEDTGDAIEEAAEDTGEAIEDAADDVEDAVEEGVNEVEENTGTGGTDDN